MTSSDAKGISGICDRFKSNKGQQQNQQNQQENQQQNQQQPAQKKPKHRQQNEQPCRTTVDQEEQKLDIPLKTKVSWAIGKKNVLVKFRLPLQILCEKFRSVKKTMTSDLKKMLFQKKSEIVQNVIRIEI